MAGETWRYVVEPTEHGWAVHEYERFSDGRERALRRTMAASASELDAHTLRGRIEQLAFKHGGRCPEPLGAEAARALLASMRRTRAVGGRQPPAGTTAVREAAKAVGCLVLWPVALFLLLALVALFAFVGSQVPDGLWGAIAIVVVLVVVVGASQEAHAQGRQEGREEGAAEERRRRRG